MNERHSDFTLLREFAREGRQPALLLRYYERQSLREVGAVFGRLMERLSSGNLELKSIEVQRTAPLCAPVRALV